MFKMPLGVKRVTRPNEVLLQLPIDFQSYVQVSENQISYVIYMSFTIQRRNMFVTRSIAYDMLMKALTLKIGIRQREVMPTLLIRILQEGFFMNYLQNLSQSGCLYLLEWLSTSNDSVLLFQNKVNIRH